MNLNQVTIPSIDVDRSVKFYLALGLRLIVDSAPRYVRLECPDGDTTLSLHHAASVNPNHSIVIYFECDRLDERVSELIGQGIIFDEMPVDQRWLWREARLKDPDGHQLVMFYAGANRKHPPWRVINTDPT